MIMYTSIKRKKRVKEKNKNAIEKISNNHVQV